MNFSHLRFSGSLDSSVLRCLLFFLASIFIIQTLMAGLLNLFFEKNNWIHLLLNSSLDYYTLVALLLAFGLLFFRSNGLSSRQATYLFASGVLVLLIFFNAFGSEQTGLHNAEPYVSRGHEFIRSILIFMIYFIFISSFKYDYKNEDRGFFVSIAFLCVCVMLIVSFLAYMQSLGFFRFQYFQYFEGVYLGRPSGGIPHPHFYAILCSIMIFVVSYLHQLGLLGKSLFLILSLVFVFGAFISTSRSGVVLSILSFLICLYSLGYFRYFFNVKSVFFITAVVLFFMFLFRQEIYSYFDVYFSFLEHRKGLLRGRFSYWIEEIELVFSSYKTALVGFGYQPFVSHNLWLRQLQVSGIVGTLAYIYILYLMVSTTLSSLPSNMKYLVVGPVSVLFIGSIVTPYLTSISLNAIICIMFFIFARVHTTGVSSVELSPMNLAIR